ncbi:hypothetical protein NBRC116493_18550 [Aurantivibrio infirmus]
MSSLQLFGSPISYYTGKVRAYLNFKKIPYTEVLSSTEVFQKTLLPRIGFPIIPVVITEDDTTLQDSTEIIDYLERLYPEPSIYPETPLQRFIALLLEVYGDEWLVIPAMHYRWNIPENYQYALRQFGATAEPRATAEEQLAIGMDRSAKFSGMVPRLGVTEKNRSAIEASYLQFLKDFEAHLLQHNYLLGSRPSIGDYGLIGPLYAHLYLDPASGKIMEENAPKVVEWVKRVHESQDFDGEFLADDEVPNTLIPLLARMFDEHIPVLMSTARQVEIWAKENPRERKIPRSIGMHEFTVEGVTEERSIAPANLWMWQRPYDYFRSLDGDSKQKVRTFFSAYPDFLDALERPLNTRIVRENFRFLIEE